MRKNGLLLFILVLALILSGCFSPQAATPTLYPHLTDLVPEMVDQSWLTDKPCKAPCWHGLEPGKSSVTDAISVLKNLTFVNPDSIDLSKMDEGYRDGTTQALGGDCKSPDSQDCVGMFFKGDILSIIFLKPNYQITFDQVVEKIGEPPNGYIAFPLSPETIGCRISLYWVKRQMSILYSDTLFSGEDTCSHELHGKFPDGFPRGIFVQTVTYMLPSEMKEIETDSSYILWDGFVK